MVGFRSLPETKRTAATTECRDPELRSLLLPYALFLCSEEEEIAFEAHLLFCGPCFADLTVLDRAREILAGLRSA